MDRNVKALLAFIDERQNRPHEWGRENGNDCVSFVLGAVKAQTGHDRATSFRWTDEKSGLKALKKAGGIEKAFDRWFTRIPPAQAMRGDVAGVPDERFGIHPMIVEGEMLVGPGDKGNKRLRRREMTAAWSIKKPTR